MTITQERTNGTNGAAQVTASTPPSVFVLMARVMQHVQAVGKNDRNLQQGYNFRGIDAVVNAAGPAFRDHGIVPVPLLEQASYRDVQTSTGKPSRECTVQVRYRFYGPAGDYIEAVVPGESMDFGDKGAPKAMSVAYRIALLQVLAIPTHEPEPDSQSYERAAAAAPSPTPEQIVENGQRAIADAKDLPTLAKITDKVVRLVNDETISDDDGAALRAAIQAKEAEIKGNRPETVAA
jgi:hypothetical protein